MSKTRFTLAALTAAAIVGPALADDSPIAWWKFDEAGGSTAADSGGTNPGTLNGAAAFVGGISGNAISTTNGWVSMGDVLPMTGGVSFSMQTWIKTTSTATSSTVIAGKHDAGTFNGYLMRANADTANYGAAGKASFYQSNSPANTAVGTSTITDDQWHCLIATYNTANNTLNLYVDGSLEKSQGITGIIANNKAFIVGGLTVNGTQVNGFDGLVDEVQLYDYALNTDQVTYLTRNPGKAIPAPGAAAVLLAAGALGRRRR